MDILEHIRIDPHAEPTLVQQLRERLVWLIASGDLQPGDLLPPLRQTAQQLKININTVRSAYQKLETEGLVETRKGSGTKVLSPDLSRFARPGGSSLSDTVGIIVPTMNNPFYQSMLEGVENEILLKRPLLFVCNTHGNPKESVRYYLKLAAKQVDGIIVCSHDAGRFLDADMTIPNRQLPIVSVDWPGFPGYSVLLDLEKAGYLATRHLLDHGHRRIGLITHTSEVNNIHPVNLGYQHALRDAGIEPDPDLVARVHGFGMQDGAEGANQLIALKSPPGALFAIADMLALGAMTAVQQAGMQIPGDVAVIGFNDISLAQLTHPTLTTVAAPAYQMGQEAMHMLQKLISGEQPLEQQITLPVELILRHSCGC